jgi:hypothetical protein
MNRRWKPVALGTLVCLTTLTIAVAGDVDLSWFTIDGGGDMFCTGGDYELSGTIGQCDAGPALTGGDYELTGGFWAIAAVPFCPGDLDGDGDTDHSDLGILLADWGCVGSGPEDCAGDLDGDFDTDHSDLGILLADWGCGM